MNQIDCQTALTAIYPWIDGELSEAEAATLCAHLDFCPPCKSHAEIEALVKNKVQQCCTTPTPPEVRQRVLMRMTTIQFQTNTNTEIVIRFDS